MARERRRAAARALLALAAALVVVTTAVVPAHAAAEDDDPAGSETSFGVSVKVQGPPAGTAPSAPPALGPGGSTTVSSPRGSSGSSAPSAVTTSPAPAPPEPGDLAVAGGLYIGDINGASAPTINPLEGRTELWFTVRNFSDETIDAAADFSLATAWGARIAGERVGIDALKAGEVRVITTTLQGSGQWPLVVGRVTFEPPATVDGQETAAVSRAATVFVLPWLLLIAGLLVAIAAILLRLSSQVIDRPTAAIPAVSAA
ncbi:MAG: hypothetical protein K0R60_204 [Microbacterium sp.]|jgi:uncharacterized membrane protein|nr:hypothetical protein [Microbacterium sp.]MDF2554309.1 hypothetical protein [Microbacterium sp.]